YAHLVICMGGDDVNTSTTINHNASYVYIIDMDGDEKSMIGVIRLEGSDLFIRKDEGGYLT
ncbi:hypothetical protein KI387_035389, partial [Taxus chinensis]